VGYQLAKYEQAKARIHRPGQTRPVQHIHLIARNTVDEKIMRALGRRAQIIESDPRGNQGTDQQPVTENGETAMNMEPLREFVSLETRKRRT
jgi:SNF2 family DNA or RNA helicase